jgi:hypothetical protein
MSESGATNAPAAVAATAAPTAMHMFYELEGEALSKIIYMTECEGFQAKSSPTLVNCASDSHADYYGVHI